MTGAGCLTATGVVAVVLLILGTAHNRQTACAAQGGHLLRGALGYVCLILTAPPAPCPAPTPTPKPITTPRKITT